MKSPNHQRYFQSVIWTDSFKQLIGPEEFLSTAPTLFDNSVMTQYNIHVHVYNTKITLHHNAYKNLERKKKSPLRNSNMD
jgi:hypothetical protein